MKTRNILLIIALVFVITALIYFWDFYYRITSPLLTNIVAGFVITVATVFGVDKILAHRESAKWKQARTGVLMEINSCLNGILTNVRGIAKVNISDLDLPSTGATSSDDWAKHISEIIIDYFEKRSNPLSAEIAQSLKHQSQKSWDAFISGLQSCIQELDRLLSMFPSITSQPELIDRLVLLRKNAKWLMSIRIIFPDILGIPLEQQPMPKDGNRESSSKSIHDMAIQSMDDLIVSVIAAKKIVDKILWN